MASASRKVRFQSLVSEAEALVRKSEYERACGLFTEALEMEPSDKQLRLARAQCYIQLGLAERAVLDAEETIRLDKSFWKGVLAKAEALYAGGNFELSLVFFFRGSKMRPEVDDFRLGLQKCRAAILSSVNQEELDQMFKDQPLDFLLTRASSMHRPRSPLQENQPPMAVSSPVGASTSSTKRHPPSTGGRTVPRLNLTDLQSSPNPRTTAADRSLSSAQSGGSFSGSATERRRAPTSLLLGQLDGDRKFLADLRNEGSLYRTVGRPQGSSSGTVSDIIEDGLAFLAKREDFWRQSNPPLSARASSTPRVGGAAPPSSARTGGPPSGRSRVSTLPRHSSKSPKARSSRPADRNRTAVDVLDVGADRQVDSDEEEDAGPGAARPITTSAAPHAAHAQSARLSARQQSHSQQQGQSGQAVAAVRKTPARSSSVPQKQSRSDAADSKTVPPPAGAPLSPKAADDPGARRKQHVQQTKYAIETLEKINLAIESGELESALKHSKTFLSKLATLDLAEKPKILSNLYSLMGTTYLELNKLTLAAIHHRKDLDIAIRYNYPDAYGRALENLGITYERMGDFSQAIRVWEKKLEVATEEEKSRLWEDVGRCYYHLNDCESAVAFAQKALDAARTSGDRERMLSVQYTIGHTYCRLNQFTDAIPYFEGYLNLARELQDVVAEVNALTDLGNAYLELGDVSKSILYQQQAMALSSKLNAQG